jgi:glycosyltransferase involved in cell wall biosynthesis
LGKPVITHVAEELYSQYNPPIYRTSKDTFKRDLETLIEDKSERSRLSKAGREYVMKNHSAETVSKTVMQSYKICNY